MTFRAEGDAARPVEPLLLTLPEVAAALRISERSLRNLTSAGRIRTVRIGTRKLVTKRELAAFVASLEGRRGA